MDKYIKREDALDAVLFALAGTGYQSRAITAIRDVPTADVVEVVRCKDCIYRYKDIDGDFCCDLDDCYAGDTGFCHYGKRRTDDENT